MVEGMQRIVEESNSEIDVNTDIGNEGCNESDPQELLEDFAKSIMQEPWGTLSRAQLNAALFRLLVDAGKIDLTTSDLAIADQLSTTPSKVSNLRYQYDQFMTKKSESYFQNLLERKQVVISEISKNSTVVPNPEDMIAIRIENKYCLTKMKQDLVERKAIPWTTLTANVIYVNPEEFSKYLFTLISIDRRSHNSLYSYFSIENRKLSESTSASLKKQRKDFEQLQMDIATLLDPDSKANKKALLGQVAKICKKEWPALAIKNLGAIQKLVKATLKVL
jgi:hypothetical protein